MPSLRRWLWPVVIASATLSLFVNRGCRRLIGNALAIRRLDRRVDSLQQEEQDLHQQIERLRKDDLAIETAARKELGYLKPGELEYRFPPPKH